MKTSRMFTFGVSVSAVTGAAKHRAVDRIRLVASVGVGRRGRADPLRGAIDRCGRRRCCVHRHRRQPWTGVGAEAAYPACVSKFEFLSNPHVRTDWVEQMALADRQLADIALFQKRQLLFPNPQARSDLLEHPARVLFCAYRLIHRPVPTQLLPNRVQHPQHPLPTLGAARLLPDRLRKPAHWIAGRVV